MNPSAKQDSVFYRTLLEEVQSVTDWTLESDRDRVDDQIHAATAERGQTGELFFRDSSTGALVTLSFPDYERGESASFLLDRPIDTTLGGSDGSFVDALSEAHRSIARNHRTPYIEPIADPSVLLRATVPAQYDDEVLRRTLRAIDKTAIEADELHESLFDVLDTYIES